MPRRSLRILLSLAVGLPLVGVLAAVSLHGPIVRAAGEKALAKASRTVGLPVTAQHFATEGLDMAIAERVLVGPPEAPLVTVRRVEADLDPETKWSFSPWPERLRVVGAVVHVTGDGSLEGALRALRDAVPRRTASGGASETRRPLPKLELDDGRLVDHAGGLEVEGIKLRFMEGHFSGEARVTHPPMGPCTFEGDLYRVRVQCAESMTVDLPGQLQVVGSGLEIERGDGDPRITLPGVKVVSTGDDGTLAARLGGLSADVTVNLEKDAEGRRPVRARLALPGGGHIVGHGRADRRQVLVRADVEGMSLDGVHPAVTGRFSGNLTVDVNLEDRRAVLEGEATFQGFRVVHPALAEGPIGPFTFSLGGKLTVEAPGKNPKKIKAVLEDGHMMVGALRLNLTGAVDNTGEHLKVSADAAIPKVSGTDLTQAIPPGLLPNLQPLRVSGHFAFNGKLGLDMGDLPNTVLDATVDLKNLQVDEISEEIGFGRLRKIFYTRFEMPDGEVIARETGPLSGRWTPLDQMPDLLPLAVMSQEDGGFMSHKGVSMLHLRGSLIRNLEQGRFARGGSTLTMQLARNLFLNRRKTLSRKLEEVVVTWLLERSFSKQELIELYLNVVEFGHDVFGIGEAARHYFHKAPRDLTPTEIAFITRLLPAPRLYGKQYEKAQLTPAYAKRMKELLKRLAARGQLSKEVADASQPEKLWEGLDERPANSDWEDAPPEDAPPPEDPPLDDW